MACRFDPSRATAALRRLGAWLTNSGYRPERHYMRGARPQAAHPASDRPGTPVHGR
ncbi:MAG: hypothetical protein IRZ13_12000 [Acetobacteraceae bacterium]|nr:hypothetical protein [Acetobacteraceae bacterium]